MWIGYCFEMVFECFSIIGILLFVCFGLGIVLMNGLYFLFDFEVIEGVFFELFLIVYVVRICLRICNVVVKVFIQEIFCEVGNVILFCVV